MEEISTTTNNIDRALAIAEEFANNQKNRFHIIGQKNRYLITNMPKKSDGIPLETVTFK